MMENPGASKKFCFLYHMKDFSRVASRTVVVIMTYFLVLLLFA